MSTELKASRGAIAQRADNNPKLICLISFCLVKNGEKIPDNRLLEKKEKTYPSFRSFRAKREERERMAEPIKGSSAQFFDYPNTPLVNIFTRRCPVFYIDPERGRDSRLAMESNNRFAVFFSLIAPLYRRHERVGRSPRHQDAERSSRAPVSSGVIARAKNRKPLPSSLLSSCSNHISSSSKCASPPRSLPGKNACARI